MTSPESCTVGFMPNGRKPGRPPSRTLAYAAATFPEWSERTRARWARAMGIMIAAEVPADVQQTVISNASRPNGSLNVADLERRAEDVAEAWIVENHG